VTLDRIKLNDNQFGKYLFQLGHWTRIVMEKYYFSSETGED